MFEALISPVFVIVAFPIALLVRVRTRNTSRTNPRVVWGSTPIINNSYWSRAMRRAGHLSETFTTDFYSINHREDWDRVLSEEFSRIPRVVRNYWAFLEALFRYDVFCISFDGFFLGSTRVWRTQAPLLRLSGKRIIVIPYGADAYEYRSIRSTALQHGLLMSYPQHSLRQNQIQEAVGYWCSQADAVVPGFMGPDGFGRWDVLTPSPLALDLDVWSSKNSPANRDDVVIAHAPNHRGFKGTEFVIDAVHRLRNEGHRVRVLLLEGLPNDEIRRVLSEDVDILVEQVVFTGHGLNGLEGMASGLPTISNLEDDAYVLPMRRWSYFSECPLVSATPENLTDVLRALVTRPELRRELGQAGRAYVEKYHGLDSAQFLFTNLIDYVYGRTPSLINLYHPLLGEYPKRSPKIHHPLVNNRIVD